MPQSNSSGNRFPSCVCIELELVPIEEEKSSWNIFKLLDSKRKLEKASKLGLYLTINFNEHWESLGFLEIKFGIKRGDLILNLKGCTSPLNLRELTTVLPLNFKKEIENQRSTSSRKALGITIPFSKANNSEGKLNLEADSSVGTKEKFEVTEFQTSIGGSDTFPSWIFEAKIDNSKPLKGLLKNAKLCTLSNCEDKVYVEAVFSIKCVLRDLCITDVRGLWSNTEEINKKKSAIIERYLLRKTLEPKLRPYLSCLKLSYE